jgi:biopolymer transport protein ExbD
MQFHKKTSLGKTSIYLRPLIKVSLVFLLFFILIILIDKIEFPSPNKEIKKIISNENFKIIK